MKKSYALIGVFLFSSSTMLGQTFQGPAFGSVPSGVQVTTDSFGPEAPALSLPEPRAFHEHQQIDLLPAPADATPPAGAEGSNYFEDPSAALRVTSVPPVPLASFRGIPDEAVGGVSRIPPDPIMAAGPTHVITVVNSRFRIYDKAGNITKTITAISWFASTLGGADPFDPKIQYDQHNERWVMVWLHQTNTPKASYYLVSVSDDSNPLGIWYNYALPGNVNGATSVNNWADYEGVGYDRDAVYLTSNQFTFADSTNPSRSEYVKVRIIPKSQLYANSAGPVSWTDLWDLRDAGGNRLFGSRPARVFGTPTEYYLISASPFSPGTYFVLHRITDPLGVSPVITPTNISVTTYNSPSNANQLGGSTTLIDAGGSNIRNEPVYWDGSLWVTHCVRSGTGGEYSSVRYVRINTATNTTVEDAALGADGFWYFYSALAVDKDNNLALTFTRSGLTEYAGAFMTWRLASDPAGLRPSVTIQAGKANYVKTFGGTRNRWGDYNGVVLDPVDQNNFWMFTEYAETPANTWGTWVHSCRLVPFSGVSIATGTASLDFGSLEAGATSDTVAVTVYNYGSEVLSINQILNSVSAFKLINLPPLTVNVTTFDSVQFRVAFQPTRHGVVNDTVTMVSNDITKPRAKIALTGKGITIGRAQPGIMYAASASQPVSQLYRIDLSTGAATVVGPTGIPEIDGMAIRPSNKEIYGTLATTTSTTLYRLASEYGDALPVATIPLGNMRAIAFSAGDTLYGGTTAGRLYRINLTSGDTTYVGTANSISYSSFAFRPGTRVLWASVRPTIFGRDRIYTVNITDGDTAYVGATGLNAITPHLAFHPSGTLYALIGVTTQTNQIYRLDLLTAAATLVGSTNVQGLLAMTMMTDTLTTSVDGPVDRNTPVSYDLHQNYPNPFNPVTTIRYELRERGHVTVKVYNMMGQEVATLVDGIQEAGYRSALFDAKLLASGMYFYRLMSRSYVATRKMIIVK